MEAVNEELDSILLEFFEVLSQLYNEQESLNDLLKDGYLNMSRARYTMGAKSVGVLQYNQQDMKASAKIGMDQKLLHLLHVDPSENETVDDNTTSETSGLRQRKVENLQATETVKSEKGPPSKDKGKKYQPLKWFGVLVPQSLRHSQEQFKRSLQHIVSVANLKQQLMLLREKYAVLEKKKLEIS